MKYLIVMESYILKEKEIKYKKNKCVDGWTTSPEKCWKFSKNGALKIIEDLKREYRINYDKGLVKFYIEPEMEESDMQVEEMTERKIQKAHCDWIKVQASELKALLQYDDTTVLLNKQRALSGIETAIQSLEEVRLYINEL